MHERVELYFIFVCEYHICLHTTIPRYDKCSKFLGSFSTRPSTEYEEFIFCKQNINSSYSSVYGITDNQCGSMTKCNSFTTTSVRMRSMFVTFKDKVRMDVIIFYRCSAFE